MDRPLPLIKGQTISQPTTVVQMTEALDVRDGDKVLEIGTGSGWQASILSRLVGKGHVYTVERFPELSNIAQKNLNKVLVNNVSFRVGDGSQGWEEHSPYDRIIVTAAAPRIISELLNQLKMGGKMVIPVGRWTQEIFVVTKERTGITKKSLGFFAFVPLIGELGFSS